MELERNRNFFDQATQRTQELLVALQDGQGVWRGQLSSSALSTATAVIALASISRLNHENLIRAGRRWLVSNQRPSGGWGDTPQSLPNLSTTLLCWAAFGGVEDEEFRAVVHLCENWIQLETGGLEPAALVSAMERRYGLDKTFAVPILMACAIGGRLGPAPQCWHWVPSLPFELAALPRRWFARLSLPVVSYALPALIAIGQVRHFHAPAAWWRGWFRKGTLRLLREIQPEGGGYLEATPLTSFVAMALASQHLSEHPVAKAAVEFLKNSCRADGSWPIDSDLATWGTTLTVKALQSETPQREQVLAWLLAQQTKQVHPYTLSAPGAWSWTDLPGGVPDADDTAGALLALAALAPRDAQVRAAAKAGVHWLLGLQNRDGGMPTFCRGWGTLPFDRSAPELTAHALAAWAGWPFGGDALSEARSRAIAYLERSQSPDGWWEPLWFGNQWAPDEANRVYGTASVLAHLAHCQVPSAMMLRAVQWLQKMQRPTGGWGGGSLGPESIEETALATTALARLGNLAAADRGAQRLLALTRNGTYFPASPIGLYFARLWYSEKLYPMIFSVAAWRAVLAAAGIPPSPAA